MRLAEHGGSLGLLPHRKFNIINYIYANNYVDSKKSPNRSEWSSVLDGFILPLNAPLSYLVMAIFFRILYKLLVRN